MSALTMAMLAAVPVTSVLVLTLATRRLLRSPPCTPETSSTEIATVVAATVGGVATALLIGLAPVMT